MSKVGKVYKLSFLNPLTKEWQILRHTNPKTLDVYARSTVTKGYERRKELEKLKEDIGDIRKYKI